MFHDNYERMFRSAFAMLHDGEEARDAVSDMFSRLWDKLQNDSGMELLPSTATAYLMRSVKNSTSTIARTCTPQLWRRHASGGTTL